VRSICLGGSILSEKHNNNSLLRVPLYNLINLLNLYFKTCTVKGGIDTMLLLIVLF